MSYCSFKKKSPTIYSQHKHPPYIYIYIYILLKIFKYTDNLIQQKQKHCANPPQKKQQTNYAIKVRKYAFSDIL